jgi:hypothetical protein
MSFEIQALPNITSSKLDSLRYEVSVRKQMLHQIITTFEVRYHCSLQELEQN